MVVGIYNVPEMMSQKKRWSEGSPDGLRAHKRCREETTQDAHEPNEASDSVPAVVLLGETGGIWHVDGLLELLAGALCATLGADPASLQVACAAEGGSGYACDVTNCNLQNEEHSDSNHRDNPSLHRDNQDPKLSLQHHNHHRPQLDAVAVSAPCSAAAQSWLAPTGLTEGNLQAHTAAVQLLPASPAPHECLLSLDDDDSSSVVSLSAWMAGSQTPRRSGSEAGSALPGSGSNSAGGPQRQQTPQPQPLGASGFSFAPTIHCFAPRWGAARDRGSVGGAAIGGGTSSSSTAGMPETRWPRRRQPITERRY